MADTVRDAVRLSIWRHFAKTGRAPSSKETAADLGRAAAKVEQAYDALAEGRDLVFAPSTRNIWMAFPFSAAPTPYRVESGGVSYWANCAWDALGIAAVLGQDTRCLARCPECGERVDLSVRGGAANSEGVIHFAVPPRRFWENVAFT